MKKSIFLLLLIGLFSFSGFSQDSQRDLRNKLQFGIKMGTNLSNVYDTKGDAFVADHKFGIVSGVFVIIPVTEILGLQSEILISQKGFSGTGVFLGSNYHFTRTTSYIDIPFLFAFKPIGLITFLAGPQYSYLFNQKDVFENGFLTVLQEEDFGNVEIRKNTLCLLGGADLNLKHLVLGGRVGFDLLSNTGDGTSTTPRYKNIWYQATIGFRF